MSECLGCSDVVSALIDLPCNHQVCLKCLNDYSKFKFEERVCRECRYPIDPQCPGPNLLPGIDRTTIETVLGTVQKILRKYPDDDATVTQETGLIRLLRHIDAYLKIRRNYHLLLDRVQKTSLSVSSEYEINGDQVIRKIDLDRCTVKDVVEEIVFTQMYRDGTRCRNYDNPLRFETVLSCCYTPICAETLTGGQYKIKRSGQNIYVSVGTTTMRRLISRGYAPCQNPCRSNEEVPLSSISSPSTQKIIRCDVDSKRQCGSSRARVRRDHCESSSDEDVFRGQADSDTD
jgi:hypothetical protein